MRQPRHRADAGLSQYGEEGGIKSVVTLLPVREPSVAGVEEGGVELIDVSSAPIHFCVQMGEIESVVGGLRVAAKDLRAPACLRPAWMNVCEVRCAVSVSK